MENKQEYPMQPVIEGRFERNPIVDWLCTEVTNLNEVAVFCAMNDIDNKYQEQLAQLVGYSVGGYGSLSYVSDESYERAEKAMSDKQETVLATEMSERDIPDFEGMAGVFDACASNELDDDAKGVEINSNGVAESFDLIDNTPQQVESLCGVTESEYDKGMGDCIEAIASQLGLTFGVNVGYADLPYKLAAHIADLKIGNAVDAVAGEWKNGDECVWDGAEAVFIGYSKTHKSRCAIEVTRDFCSVIDTVFIEDISKPESPQEKAKREREEAINMMVDDFLSCDVESLSEIDGKVAKVCLALYDAGYRKGE